jgi:hypothetical protein
VYFSTLNIEAVRSSETSVTSTTLDGITSQKIVPFIVISVRISDITPHVVTGLSGYAADRARDVCVVLVEWKGSKYYQSEQGSSIIGNSKNKSTSHMAVNC